VAPASRIAIGEEFGFEPGTVSTGRLVNALRALGFDHVFDTNFAADVTIMEEATELLQRVAKAPGSGPLPLFTSCCPGWVNYVEISRPDLLPHLSTTKSPQQMHGAITKRGPFAALTKTKLNAAGAAAGATAGEPFVVAVMPCTAKKEEAVRPGMGGDVDAVLTTRELARLLRARHVPFAALSNSGSFDNPLGESTGAAQIFGASGGVMEAALRTAVCVLNPQAADADRPLEFQAVRGVRDRVKVAQVDGVGKVAVVNGIAAAVELLSTEAWREEFVMIEVMACVGGCLGGGGEPKSDDPDVLQKRMRGVYAIDAGHARRRSHENPDVQRLYATVLTQPMSHEAERLLHRTYAPRGSLRELVARFFEAVDHRQAAEAAALFEEDGEWQPFPGAPWAKGRAAIAAAVAELPLSGEGADLQRHRFLDPVEGLEMSSGAQRLRWLAVPGRDRKRQLRRLESQAL
jgi:NADH-quinone oxidoreductase subunit G